MDISWKNGDLLTCTVHSLKGTQFRIRYGKITKLFELNPGEKLTLSKKDFKN